MFEVDKDIFKNKMNKKNILFNYYYININLKTIFIFKYYKKYIFLLLL